MSVMNVDEEKKCETESGTERADRDDDTEAQRKSGEEGGVQRMTSKQSPNEVEPGKIRKKHRRGSKKHKPRKPRYKWRPYNKLSWEEKRKLNERDTIRAERRREEIRQKGRPIAPYNTTQFLMNEHDTIEPDLRDLSPDAYTNSPAFNITKADVEEVESSASDESSFYEKDFSEMYAETHAETLHSMSKEQLIENYLELENRIEFLEKQVRMKRGSCSLSSESSINSCGGKDSSCCGSTKSLKAEELTEEKDKLVQENKTLREELEALKTSKCLN
eukprot:gene3258-3739_t